VLLVGDAAYYSRFGFTAQKTQALSLPGADPSRLLVVELRHGALDGAHGAVTAAGERESRSLPRLAARPQLIPRAA
jgi:predicted N-acetyltransferase YhbS